MYTLFKFQHDINPTQKNQAQNYQLLIESHACIL